MADDDNKKDQKVNGPMIAAKILMRMPKQAQERIVAKIKQSSPEIAERVQESMLRFEDLAGLTPKSIQTLLREVDQRDVVLSLKGADNQVKAAIFQSVSERKQQMLIDETNSMQEISTLDVESAKRRILLKLDELRELGKIREESSSQSWIS